MVTVAFIDVVAIDQLARIQENRITKVGKTYNPEKQTFFNRPVSQTVMLYLYKLISII